MTTPTRKIALIGGSGQIGSHILSNLLSSTEHEITVLTREESTATFPSSSLLTIAKLDFSSQEALIDALRGHDILIITLFARTSPSLHERIVAAAVSADVPRVMPNYFGFGLSSDGRGGKWSSDPLLSPLSAPLTHVRAYSPSSLHYTALVCGFWYEFSLSKGPEWFGFDIPGRIAVFYVPSASSPLPRINTSTFAQCGRAIALFTSLPSTDMENYNDKGLYIKSFCLTQRDMLNSLHRVLGTKDEQWTIRYQAADERYAEGLKRLQGGDVLGFAQAMYARLFFGGEEGCYEEGGLDNEVLGLPREELDEATRRAVEGL